VYGGDFNVAESATNECSRLLHDFVHQIIFIGCFTMMLALVLPIIVMVMVILVLLIILFALQNCVILTQHL